jgi:hypothetical protein
MFLAICALSLGLTSTVLASSSEGTAYVRVVHASPAAGPVDVFVDGKSTLTNFTFGTVTDYVPVPAGSHLVQVAPAGKGIASSVISQYVAVNAGVPYTVAAVGTKDSGFALRAFSDDNRVTAGIAKARVYHLSSNAGPVDIDTGGKTVVPGLTYARASGYLNVPANAYTFNVRALRANATIPVAANLRAGTVTSVFALGQYQGDPSLRFVSAVARGVQVSAPARSVYQRPALFR